jgi:hypothetical protein
LYVPADINTSRDITSSKETFLTFGEDKKLKMYTIRNNRNVDSNTGNVLMGAPVVEVLSKS